MPFYTYILESTTSQKLYIGQTNDLVDRLLRHNSDRNKSTTGKGPWTILFSKEFATRMEAYQLEQKLKSWKNPAKVREWIATQKA